MSESPRILIVDDSPEDRETYRRLLRQGSDVSYAFLEADSGAAALEAIAFHRPDCVLLDYRLPDGDGIEVLQQMSGCGGGTDECAVIVLTGQGSELVAVEAMKAGARDYLVKGELNAPALTRAVRNAIEKTRLLHSVRRQQFELERTNAELRREVAQRRLAEEALHRNSEDLERLVEARTAELSRANRLKDEFLATVSHELRTPLNAILGWSHVLRETSVPPHVQTQALEAIERNVRWQASLIDDILDVSRIVSGKLRLESRSVDLATILDSALEAVRATAAGKEVQVETSIERPAPGVGDPDRLRQVVSNLLSNALKFTPGGGRVDLRLRACEHHYEVEVQDTGVGIAPSFLPHVFEPFRQGDASPTRSHGGLGLGLAIVRQLVERSGGTVRAESPGPGQGSTFTITLPRPARPLQPDGSGDTNVHDRAGVPDLRNIVLLAVDDDAETRRMLSPLLAQYGARVVCVGSVQDALAAVSAELPHVLLTDIALPDWDGFTLLRRIREHEDEHVRGIPAIALTAYAGEDAARRAAEAGFQAHLAKPVDPHELAAVLERLLQRAAGAHG